MRCRVKPGMTERVRFRIKSGMTGEDEIPEQVRNDEWVKSSGMIPGGLVDEKFPEFVREDKRDCGSSPQ